MAKQVSPELSAQLVAAVRAHAIKNYEKGWDIVVETMDDEEIVEMLRETQTTVGAIRVIGTFVNLHFERYSEVIAEVF